METNPAPFLRSLVRKHRTGAAQQFSKIQKMVTPPLVGV
jgi:hypothetical protein